MARFTTSVLFIQCDAKCFNIMYETQEPFPNGICIHMPLDGGAGSSKEPLGFEEDDNPNEIKISGEKSMAGSL